MTHRIIRQYGEKEIADLIKIVKERFIPSPCGPSEFLYNLIEQKKDDTVLKPFQYGASLKDEDLLRHFAGEPIYVKSFGRTFIWGSLSILPTQEDGTVKFIGLDADAEEETALVIDKLLPWLESHSIDYLYEFAGSKLQKIHVWIFLEKCPQALAQQFMDHAMQDCGLGRWRKDRYNLELFGSHKDKNKLRLPLGVHLKRLRDLCREEEIDFRDQEAVRAAFPYAEEFICPVRNLRGKKTTDLKHFRKLLESIKPATPAQLYEILPSDLDSLIISIANTEDGITALQEELAEEHDKFKMRPITDPESLSVYCRHGEFCYRPNGKKVKSEVQLPPFVNTIVRQCPAFKALFEAITKESMLEDQGGTTHNAGLYMANLFVAGQYYKGSWGEGSLAAGEAFFDHYRWRPWESHQWFRDVGYDERMRLVPRCETMERDFDLCGNCKFREVPNFTSPKQLYSSPQQRGGPLTGKVLKVINVSKTNETLKKEMVEAIRDNINYGLSGNHPTLVINRYGQGVGKSRGADELIAEYARKGKKQLLSVMSGQLAAEHKEDLERRGVRVQVLGSRKNLFQYIEKRFECPNAEEIDEYSDFCISREHIRKEFCNDCPFLEDCLFPKQQEAERVEIAQVVIIQHAHLRLPQVMQKLTEDRSFDIVWYDEEIIDNLQGQRYLTKKQAKVIRFFAQRDYEFGKEILRWQRSAVPYSGKPLQLGDDEKLTLGRFLKKSLGTTDLKWLMEIINSINNKHAYQRRHGAHYFYPPVSFRQVSVQVVLNATAQPQIIRDVFNAWGHRCNVIEIGKSEFTDIKAYHPDNRIVKILGASVSKTKLSNLVYYHKLLTWIAEQLRTVHAGQSGLITVYKGHVKAVRRWFVENAPDLMDRVTFDWMQPGTNKYRQTAVQFLLCAVHLSDEQIALQVWQRKNIHNYWIMREGKRTLLPNPFDKTCRYNRQSRRLPFRDNLGRVLLVEFKNFLTKVPSDINRRAAYNSGIGKTQQAGRIRYFKGQTEGHTLYDFTSYDFPGFAYTEVIPASEIFGLRPTGG